jgi:hypothetical protein
VCEPRRSLCGGDLRRTCAQVKTMTIQIHTTILFNVSGRSQSQTIESVTSLFDERKKSNHVPWIHHTDYCIVGTSYSFLSKCLHVPVYRRYNTLVEVHRSEQTPSWPMTGRQPHWMSCVVFVIKPHTESCRGVLVVFCNRVI